MVEGFDQKMTLHRLAEWSQSANYDLVSSVFDLVDMFNSVILCNALLRSDSFG
ncbi:Hypothetical protein ETEE_p1037 (plasmid) [Edwardsiella anguillarum ET080813]|uniref:Uncharacterized protein n=1 Tax=Edwardsiella anguillarum ET080813 TaxID=667120 RepID=A0A076LVV1_9GAMM|nr:Hypothetical protein ETEE_p1037 [Edwardsiella anguillarum ET080813]